MNERFVVGVYASLATGNLRLRLGEYHRRFPDVDAQTVDCGQDTLQTDLAGSAIDLAMMTTNERPGQIRRDHSTRGRIRRLLRSTGLAVAIGSFLASPDARDRHRL
jgi:DNA-binding transcriptional LysR family regulator